MMGWGKGRRKEGKGREQMKKEVMGGSEGKGETPWPKGGGKKGGGRVQMKGEAKEIGERIIKSVKGEDERKK